MLFRELGHRAVLQSLVAVTLIWVLLVVGYEVKVLKRPALATAGRAIANDHAAPLYGLANVSFACASQHGFATIVQLSQDTKMTVTDVRCENGFTDATTRCPSALPMSGFGEQIKCPKPEAVHCHGGPLQTLGLFKDDSFCGDVSDRDLGPPQESPRADSED